MATFNEIFNQRLGKDLPKFNPTTNVNVEARKSNDQRAFRLASILAADAEYKKNQAKQQGGSAPSNFTGKSGNNEQVITDNADFSFGGSLKDFGKSLLDIGTRGLDIISRPAYGTFEAMKEASQSANEGQNAIQSIDDVLGGFWSGLSGQEKTGFGQVIEENANRTPGSLNPLHYLLAPTSAFGEGLNSDSVNPEVSKWAKRGLGLAGELALDPFNYVGVGLAGKVGKGVKGLDEAKDFYKVAIKEAAKEAGLEDALKLNGKVATSITNDLGEKISPNLPRYKTAVDDVVEQVFNDVPLEIQKGQAAGRIYGVESIPITVASKVGNSLKELHYKRFESGFEKLLSYIDETGDLTDPRIRKLFDNELKDFQSSVTRQFNLQLKKRYGSLEDVLKGRKAKSMPDTVRIFKDAAEDFTSLSEDLFTRFQDDIYKKLEGKIYNAPAIKFAGMDVASLDRVGAGYAKLRSRALQSDLGKAAKGISYGKVLPGRAGIITQKIRALGDYKYEKFHNEVKQVAETLTKAERADVQRAILNGTDFTDSRLQAAKEFVQEKYAQIWNEEMAAGVHKVNPEAPFENFASNYVYLYHRKNTGNFIDQLRKESKDAVKANHALPANALERAKAKGLAPVEDAFEALLLRQIKSNRELSRSLFMRDLLNHYGFQGRRLSEKAVGDRSLVKITEKLPDDMRRALKEGQDWYLPNDVHGFYDEYNKLVSLNQSEEARALLKTIDKLTRLFKMSATLPYPGFHIRNSLGDIFMSSLDGVTFRDYSVLARAMEKARSGVDNFIRVGDRNIPYTDIDNLYRKYAASGNFVSTDLNSVDELFASINPNRVVDKAKTLSEGRENFFRKAHFIRAFKDEYPTALKRAKGDIALAERNAAEAATYRVNKALFDYGALTTIERQGFRRAIPFYTYSRKVMPTLLEAMVLSPKNLSRANRWLIDNQQDSKNFNSMLIPDYRREIGFATLIDQSNPWVGDASFLPTSVLRENMNIPNMPDAILQNVNPYLKMIPELKYGRLAFNDQEIQSVPDYLTSNIAPPVRPIADVTNKLGLDLSKVPFLGAFSGESNKNWAEIGLGNRFALGLPIRKIKENQQAASLYSLTADVKRELGKVDDKIKENGLSIYVSQRKEGTSFRVRDDETGQVLFESTDAKAAADFATRANNAKSRFRNS